MTIEQSILTVINAREMFNEGWKDAEMAEIRATGIVIVNEAVLMRQAFLTSNIKHMRLEELRKSGFSQTDPLPELSHNQEAKFRRQASIIVGKMRQA